MNTVAKREQRGHSIGMTRCPHVRVVASFVLVIATVPGAAAAVSQAAADITFETSAPYYDPPVALVPAGIPVRWINATASHHSVRHDACLTETGCAFQSIAVPPDSSVVIGPLPPGRYSYHCELHPVMRGTLIVTAPTGEADAVVSFSETRR